MRPRIRSLSLLDMSAWTFKGEVSAYVVKTLCSDILYNSKILYNVNCICTNVPVKLEFEFITTEIQFNVKLFEDSVVVKRVY